MARSKEPREDAIPLEPSAQAPRRPFTMGSLKVLNKFISGRIADVKIVAIAGNLKDPLFVAKMYKVGFGDEKATTIKFDREFDVLRRSVHPNIVKRHKPTSDCRELGIHNIICLELMDLGSLKHVLPAVRQQVQQPEHLHEFAKAIAVQCLLGLQYLHAHGFMHRDVKPENILLSKDGRVKWCDFDCCKKAATIPAKVAANCSNDSARDRNTDKIGTGAYMAPEVFLSNGASYTEKVDLWSLGCVLYWMVTNETPQTSLTIDIIDVKLEAHKQLTTDEDWQPREVFDLDNTIHDAELRDLIFHLLEVNPDKRFNSFEALRHPALSKYYRGPGVIPRDDKHKKVVAPFTQRDLPMDTAGCTEESELDVIAKISKGEYGECKSEHGHGQGVDTMKNSFKVLTYSRQKPAVDYISQFLGSYELPCLVEPAVLAAWNEENKAIASAASGAGVV